MALGWEWSNYYNQRVFYGADLSELDIQKPKLAVFCTNY